MPVDPLPEPGGAIAIVGIGGHFAGSATPEQLWATIRAGTDATSDVPPGRWLIDPAGAFDRRAGLADHVASTRGGFVAAPRFDPAGTGLDAEFVDRLDPVFHLALDVACQAWRDARTEAVDRRRAGVIFGHIVLPTETASALSRDLLGVVLAERLGVPVPTPGPREPLNAFPAGLPAAIVARALGLGGVAYTIDAACGSSLYALKLAADELRAGRADLMLSGGVSRPDALYTQMGFSQLRALSPRGTAAPLDHRADGLVVGEGAGMFVLKRLADALRHGDHIYGIVAGIGLSNDLHGDLLAPDAEGQLRALRAAYDQAGWRPQEVDLIECHATGTPRGDAVELESLKSLWGASGWRAGQCVIGSVKANLGHALTAAGAAGLLKVLLALKHRVLPPTANFERPAPSLGLEKSPFRVLTTAQPWPARAPDQPRRAAVSGFGFGGINAHILIEEWTPRAAGGGRQAAGGGDSSSRASSRTSHQSPATLHPPPTTRDAPIAIVGLSAQIGAMQGTEAFREFVLGGERPSPARRESPWWGAAERPAAAWQGGDGRSFPGYYLTSLELPVGQFRIPPKELAEMLPQQSLMLRVAAEAIRDAGWAPPPSQLRCGPGPRTGVLIGIGLDLNTTNFHLRWWLAERAREWNRTLGLDLAPEELARWIEDLREAVGPPLTANRTMGSLGGLVASRIAREFRIGGPSFTVSCDETSGIQALAIAVEWLRCGELDAAIVGAVDFAGDIRAILARQQLRLDRTDAADDGPRSYACDGAVSLVLKRLDDARRGGDRIYAVIRGLGSATGGMGSGPDPRPAAADRAMAQAGVPASDGPVPCAFGSLRADIGEAGAADGLLAVAKAALWLHHRLLSPSRAEAPRRAAIGATSLGGNSAHVILEEPPGRDATAAELSPEDARPSVARRFGLCGGRADPDGASTGGLPSPPCPSFAVGPAPRPTIRVDVGGGVFPIPPLPSRPRLPTVPTDSAMPQEDIPAPPATTMSPPPLITLPAEGCNAETSGLLSASLYDAERARLEAHRAFLRSAEAVTDLISRHLAFQLELIEAWKDGGAPPVPAHDEWPAAGPVDPAGSPDSAAAPLFDRRQCLELAGGSVAAVFGPDFAEVDRLPRRVRLPDEPLMLVDRILTIEGAPRSLGGGRIVTEHVVQPGAWYLDGDRVAPCIAMEAGQADLVLSGYLGVDFVTRGRAVYRLLDATVTFHRGLPGAGRVLRYDIRITSFFRQGTTILFRFEFDATVAGEPLLTMRDGCAGFFTPEELASGKGIVARDPGVGSRAGRCIGHDDKLIPTSPGRLDERQVEALRRGDLARAFGAPFDRLSLADPIALPGGRMALIHRVQDLDPTGGPSGLGVIRAEADIHPGEWFMACHFIDDRVMPGTLMYEGCLHALRVFLMRLGWIGRRGRVAFEPVPGIAHHLKCRGQITEATRVVAYEVAIKERGYRPEPYAVADALIIADGKPIVTVTDLALQLTDTSREELERLWEGYRSGE